MLGEGEWKTKKHGAVSPPQFSGNQDALLQPITAS